MYAKKQRKCWEVYPSPDKLIWKDLPINQTTMNVNKMLFDWQTAQGGYLECSWWKHTITCNIHIESASNQKHVQGQSSMCYSFRHITRSKYKIQLSEFIVNTCFLNNHYIGVIMATMASRITSLTVIYSTVYSDADQGKHQSSASLAFVCGIHRDRRIHSTKGQLRGKCFHLMTSSWLQQYP